MERTLRPALPSMRILVTSTLLMVGAHSMGSASALDGLGVIPGVEGDVGLRYCAAWRSPLVRASGSQLAEELLDMAA